MTLQVSRLNPSVLMSVPVKTANRKSCLRPLQRSVLNVAKRRLTFGYDLVHDGLELVGGDFHVLKQKQPISREEAAAGRGQPRRHLRLPRV